jgi:2-methylcitrate dehydratase PrpD
MTREPALSTVLGGFVADSRWERVGPPLRHEAKRSLLNFFGGALGVAQDPAVEAARGILRRFSGAPEATVIGHAERLDLLGASFVNAVASNLLDYDDTHLRTVIHPTAPVAPPVLALAEARGLSGAEVLHAFILGAEVECRLGNAVSPGHYARGWHITATCGVFGAAAASAKLLGLDAARTAHALGIAASQSAGLVENLPSAAKNVGVGNAARNGLFAALLAEAGYAAAPTSIEGRLGWARAMGDEPVLTEVTEGLGDRYEFQKNTYKPYPAGIVFHAVIEACLLLRQQHGLSADDIRHVTVTGQRLLLERGDRAVANERDARVSIHHSAAAAFLWGAAGIDEFSTEKVMEPRTVAFRQRVSAERDDGMPVGAARVTVETARGATHTATVIHPRGSIEAPLSDDEIAAKVRALAHRGSPGCAADRVIELVWRLDEAADIGALMRELRIG